MLRTGAGLPEFDQHIFPVGNTVDIFYILRYTNYVAVQVRGNLLTAAVFDPFLSETGLCIPDFDGWNPWGADRKMQESRSAEKIKTADSGDSRQSPCFTRIREERDSRNGDQTAAFARGEAVVS